MSAAHTRTPWRYFDPARGQATIRGKDDDPVAMCYSGPTRPELDKSRANAAHIVRCVNAHDALVDALKLYVGENKFYTERERKDFGIKALVAAGTLGAGALLGTET